MRMKERSFAEIFRNEEKILAVCKWNGNNDIRIATNKTNSDSLRMIKCKRWSKQKKKVVVIP